MAEKVSVKIFSDYVCPFGYLGHPAGDDVGAAGHDPNGEGLVGARDQAGFWSPDA